jgi:hypothetical protein
MTNPAGFMVPGLPGQVRPRPFGPIPEQRPQGPRSIWDRIETGLDRFFGAPSELPLSDPERAYARRQGLLAAGSSLLASRGMPLLEALGHAVPAAQGAAMGSIETSRAMQMQQARQQIAQKYGGKMDLPSLLGMYGDLFRIGDYEGAKLIGEQLKALQAEGSRLMQVDRGNEIELVDPQSGLPVRRVPKVQPPGQAQQQSEGRATQLYGQFLQQTPDFAKIALSYRGVLSAAEDPSPAGDMAMIFNFMKILDPGSTVREGEYATAQNTGSVPTRMRQLYNNVVDGTKLTPGQRQDFLNQAHARARSSKAELDRVRDDYGKRASRWGLNPDDVSYDFFSGMVIPGRPGAVSKENPLPR